MANRWIDKADWDRMMDGLIRSRYALLLGAGASFGSVNRAGEPLPLGAQLADELVENYGMPSDSRNQPLRAVYDAAEKYAKFKGFEHPALYLKRRFDRCSVPPWYEDLVRTPWRVIWNLNIDDVLTNAYGNAFARQARQRLRTVSWDEKAVFHREPSDQVTAIHLHGRAAVGNLVFGSAEYLGTASHRGAGHQLFANSWSSTPTVVIGATLSEEIDLADALQESRIAGDDDPPSIVVLKHVTDFDRFRLEPVGLLAIEATAGEFFEAVRDDWDNAVARLDDEQMAETNGIDPAAAYFLSHFRRVARPRKADHRHDFYAGHSPVYADIVDGRDASRRLDLPPNPHDAMPKGARTIVVFHGPPLSGKSTAKLRFVKSCNDAGLVCWEYDDESAFDAGALSLYFARNPTSVLLVENLNDYRAELTTLLDTCAKAGTTLRIVTTLRDTQIKLLAGLDEHVRLVRVPDRLQDGEIRDLLAKLGQNDRLNVLQELKPDERFKFFRDTHRRNMPGGLEAASRGRGFLDRARDDYQQVASSVFGEAQRLVCLSATVGESLHIGVFSSALNMSFAQLREGLANTPFGDLAFELDGLLRARQPSLAASVFKEELSADDRYRTSLLAAVALAPYITKPAIRARTRYARFVGGLMNSERVVTWFSRSRVDEWYEELRDLYGWNARYWEQRALTEAESTNPAFEKAESWARRAIGEHRDSYSLNTLAKVLFKRSLASGQVEVQLFDEALGYVGEARDDMKRPSEYPYVTALTYITEAFKLTDRGGQLAAILRARFNSWYEAAERADVFEFPGPRELLNKRKKDFLYAVAEAPR